MTDQRWDEYDIEASIVKVRAYIRQSDPAALTTVRHAEVYARHFRRSFAGRDLRLVAEALLMSSAAIGGIHQQAGPIMSSTSLFAINVQAAAAVLILDELAMQAAEAGVHP